MCDFKEQPVSFLLLSEEEEILACIGKENKKQEELLSSAGQRNASLNPISIQISPCVFTDWTVSE